MEQSRSASNQRQKVTPFFIASEDELHCVEPQALDGAEDADGPEQIDLLMLCNLEAILTGSDWENIFDRVYMNPVRDHGPDGPLVYQVSNGLLEALRGLSPESLLNCANLWAETDEWELRQDPPEKIADVVHGLMDLAERASAEGKNLFLWTRLY